MSETTEFEYLLNAMERSAQSKNPARAGFAAKRQAVLEYVAALERERANIDVAYQMGRQVIDWLEQNAGQEVRLTRDPDDSHILVTRWHLRYVTYQAARDRTLSQAVRQFRAFDRSPA